MVDKVKQGKKNRVNGMAFERKVRMILYTQNFSVSKWQNNICLKTNQMKAAGWNRFNASSCGFPDFVAFRVVDEQLMPGVYEMYWVEAKMNGFLTREEKEKMQFMEDRGMECWIAYDDNKKVAFRKFVDYIETGRVRGKEVKYKIG